MVMLSPAEEVGLSGLGLDSRLRQVFYGLSPDTLRDLDARMRREALARGLVYLRDGRPEPVRVMLRPFAVLPDQLAYVHSVSLTLLSALKRLPDLYLADPDVRRLLPLSPGEEEWLRDCWGPLQRQQNPIFGRLDAVCEFTTPFWKQSLCFLEPNLCGVGGVHMAPACEELLLDIVAPVIAARDPSLRLGRGADQRDLLIGAILDHLAESGRRARTLCFLEPRFCGSGPEEQEALARYYHDRHGLRVLHADPRELSLRGDEVLFEGEIVDLAYRDYEVRDLIALAADEGVDVSPVRALLKQNRVISSIGGELDHKSSFELLTDPELAARHFSAEERHVFRRHVLWTRVLGDRRTTLLDGAPGDLLPYVRAEREHLVLKPSRSYGGDRILLGPALSQGEWEAAIAAALAEGPDWVVQRMANIPVAEFPVVGPDGEVGIEPFYTVLGFAPTEEGLGVLCRASQKQVVNVAQRGGLCGLLVAEVPAAPRGPGSRAPAPAGASALARPAATLLADLRARVRELVDLEAVSGVLGWDEETYLPARGRLARGRQIALLEGLHHARLTDPALGDLLADLGARGATAATPGDEAALRAALRVLGRRRDRALRVPADLVRALAEARSETLGAWEGARLLGGTYGGFLQPFRRLLALTRERAAALATVLGPGAEPYEALLDEYEPGLSRARLDPLLGELRAGLVPLLQRIAAAPAPAADFLEGDFPGEAQFRVTLGVLADLGFDLERGRQDRSSHPFTQQCGEDDVRVTTRIDPRRPLSGLLATIHEAGHGLYDQGFDPAHHGTLLAEAPSSGLHESQARLWENHVGRSRAFWDRFGPRLAAAFPQLAGVPPGALHRAVCAVRPGWSRVEADEVGYNLHILLRYELEAALLSGDLAPEDLPGAFAERMVAYLGVAPASEREGCLQDVHWAMGYFGYFPSYTVGNLYAAQLFAACEAELGDLSARHAAGDFAPLLGWLRARVHRRGHLLPPEELIREATGAGLSAGPFLAYLRGKYGALYDL